MERPKLQPPEGYRILGDNEVVETGDLVSDSRGHWGPTRSSRGNSPLQWATKGMYKDLLWATKRPNPADKEWLNPWD